MVILGGLRHRVGDLWVTLAVRVQTLRTHALKGFREETNTELVSLESPLVGKFANAVNVYSKAGVLRMAWISDGPMGVFLESSLLEKTIGVFERYSFLHCTLALPGLSGLSGL